MNTQYRGRYTLHDCQCDTSVLYAKLHIRHTCSSPESFYRCYPSIICIYIDKNGLLCRISARMCFGTRIVDLGGKGRKGKGSDAQPPRNFLIKKKKYYSIFAYNPSLSALWSRDVCRTTWYVWRISDISPTRFCNT